MTEAPAEARSVIVERDLSHPPEKVWRALTQPHLIGEWLMKTDFEPVVGQRFSLRAEWGAVACEVLEVEPHTTLAYTWIVEDLRTVVIWTLTPTDTGTRLRMEQNGFRPDQPQNYHGARTGWPRFVTALEEVLERMD